MTEPAGDQLPGLPDPSLRQVTRFEWERVIRRVRLGFYDSKVKDPKRWMRHALVQQVALVASTYGDMDGTRVKPAADRLALVCEIDERQARVAMKRLRDVGLLQLVRPHRPPGRAGGPGRAAEYRLTVPEDLLTRVAHLDPDERHVIVPDGVDVRPKQKPRPKVDRPDEALWISGETDPVDDG